MSSYQDRAKQFLPYSSLRGFESIVDKKRNITEARRELATDAEEELSYKIGILKSGDEVSITYYKTDKYVTVRCVFREVDELMRIIRTEELSVPIDDIFAIDF